MKLLNDTSFLKNHASDVMNNSSAEFMNQSDIFQFSIILSSDVNSGYIEICCAGQTLAGSDSLLNNQLINWSSGNQSGTVLLDEEMTIMTLYKLVNGQIEKVYGPINKHENGENSDSKENRTITGLPSFLPVRGIETKLQDLIKLIRKDKSVLIKNNSNSICGIVSVERNSVRLLNYGETSYLIGELERMLEILLVKGCLECKEPCDVKNGVETYGRNRILQYVEIDTLNELFDNLKRIYNKSGNNRSFELDKNDKQYLTESCIFFKIFEELAA